MLNNPGQYAYHPHQANNSSIFRTFPETECFYVHPDSRNLGTEISSGRIGQAFSHQRPKRVLSRMPVIQNLSKVKFSPQQKTGNINKQDRYLGYQNFYDQGKQHLTFAYKETRWSLPKNYHLNQPGGQPERMRHSRAKSNPYDHKRTVEKHCNEICDAYEQEMLNEEQRLFYIEEQAALTTGAKTPANSDQINEKNPYGEPSP